MLRDYCSVTPRHTPADDAAIRTCRSPLGSADERSTWKVHRACFSRDPARGLPAGTCRRCTESGDVVADHLADNDGLLLHLLMSDLVRMTVCTYAAGDVAVTDRLLEFINWCLREGDEYVANAVAVSFVEDFGAHPRGSDALLKRWPPALRAELGR